MIYLTGTLKHPLILQTWSSATISGGLSSGGSTAPSLHLQLHSCIHSPIPVLQLRVGSVGHPPPTPAAHSQVEKFLPGPPVMSMPELTGSLFLLHHRWLFPGFTGNSPVAQHLDKDEGKEMFKAFIFSHRLSPLLSSGLGWGHKAKKPKTIRNK